MNYRSFPKIPDVQVSALGFGFMRLPTCADGSVDVEATRSLVKTAYENGINYYDTAWVYHGGESEKVLGRILEEEGLRDKVYVATKMPCWDIKVYDDFERILDAQLEKLRTDHIDFYLMHAMHKARWEEMMEKGAIKFLEKAKADGKIRHIGFSFHDSIDAFKFIVDSYAGWEFCQIQYNYLDDDGEKTRANPGKQALEYAAAHEIGVVIMEPLRGGMLANPPKGITDIFKDAPVPRLPAEWGLKFIWERQEVTCVLSGMNEMTQVLSNCAFASNSHPNSMPAKEMDVVMQAKKWFEDRIKVPCTGCSYCMPCPKGVDIPAVFREYNGMSMRGAYETTDRALSTGYANMVKGGHGQDKCVRCGLCMKHCPQGIQIPDRLKEADTAMTV